MRTKRARNRRKMLSLGGIIFLTAALAAGCGFADEKDSGPIHLAVIIGAHANAPRVNTSVMYDSVLEACTQSGSTISLIVNDGAPYASVVTVPETKSGLSSEKYQAIAEERAKQIVNMADQMFAKTAESDLLSAITLAGRQLSAEEGGRKEMIVIDSGLSTAAPLDFLKACWKISRRSR